MTAEAGQGGTVFASPRRDTPYRNGISDQEVHRAREACMPLVSGPLL